MSNFFWGERLFCFSQGRCYLPLLIFSMFLSTGHTLGEDAGVVDRIVAVVNDEIITLYDLNQMLEPYARNIKALGYAQDKEDQMLTKVRSDVLNELIDRRMADQEIQKLKLTVTDNEIDNTIERIKMARSYTDDDIRAGLAEQGMTMEEYRKELTEQLLRSKLVSLEVKSKIVITKANIQSYYNSHPEKFAGEKKYHLWNIYITLSAFADDDKKQSAFKKMEAIRAKLKQGQRFESLVNDPFLATLQAQGGELGLFLLTELAPQLQQVVERMNAGEFSAILDTDYGYQIIYVQKVLETPAKSLLEVEKEIEDILYREAVDSKYQQWLEDLRKRSHIKIIS